MSISVSSAPQTVPVETLLGGAAEAGFQAVELTLADDGLLAYRVPKLDCDRIADCVRQAGLTVSALAAQGTLSSNLITSDHPVRRAACQQAVAAMDRARWLGTNALILPMPPTLGGARPGPRRDHQTIFAQVLEAFHALRFEAERRAVRVVCGNGWNHFLSSPFEMRRFIDEISSPWIGACLDITDPLPAGSPEDWIGLLGHRLVRVYAGDRSGKPADIRQDMNAVVEAMRLGRYDGPITYHGTAEPRQAISYLKALFAN